MPLGTAVDGTATYGLTEGVAAYDPDQPVPTPPAYDEVSFPLPPTAQSYEDISVAVLRSLGEAPSPLNQLFFSRRNLDMLQRGLVKRVLEKLHTRISRQSDRDMLLLMRRVYLETAANPLPSHPSPSRPSSSHPSLLCPLMSASKPTPRAKVLAQVSRLNELVAQKAEEMVSRNIIRYVLYRKSLTQPKVLPHPAEAVRMPRWVLGSPTPPRNLNVAQM